MPKTLSDLRIAPEGAPDALDAGREVAMSRQGAWKHLRRMEEARLIVRRSAKPGAASPDEYVVNHQSLFAIGESVRALATLRPFLEPDADTMRREMRATDAVPKGPHVVVAHGLDEGAAHALAADRASAPGEWTIGRRRSAPISRDYVILGA